MDRLNKKVNKMATRKRDRNFEKYPVRIPTAKATEWHKNKKRYNRKEKYKKIYT
jgi:hypothetical protein